MNVNQRNSLLVNGYIRGSESLKALNIPSAVIPIIVLFYPSKFCFQSDHPTFKVSEDGQSASIHSSEDTYGTILFGPFIEQNEKIKIKITFTSGKSGYNGFGFATNKFEEFKFTNHNYDRENYSRMIFYEEGQKMNSVSKKWKSSYFAEHPSFDSNNSKAPNGGDHVCVELNMITKIGKIYNKQHPDKPSALIDLHSGDGIAIALAFSPSAWPIRCIDQEIEYQNNQ